MSVIHPSPDKIEALRGRWQGQEKRLRRIAAAMLAGEDWTVHLRGLRFVREIPPLEGEACGRDLRGADLSRYLHPPIEIRPATESEAALIAGITLEAMRSNTPLPSMSPFPADVEGAEEVRVAIRRGETFLLARCGAEAVGVIRLADRSEFRDLTLHRSYIEISGLAVRPDHRRNGIGSALLAAAENHATADGYEHTLLRTSMEVGLVPYYERRGYGIRHVRQLSYPGSPTFLDVVMSKRMATSAGAAAATPLRRVAE